jgi:hypothetical protein
MQVFRDSTRKQRSLDSKDSSLNREGNDVKGPHASAHKQGIMREATGEETGAEPGRNGPGIAGLGRPTQPTPGRVRIPFLP